jgi:hypothetical protein
LWIFDQPPSQKEVAGKGIQNMLPRTGRFGITDDD